MRIIVKPAQELLESEIASIADIMSKSYFESKMAINFYDGIKSDIRQLCAYAEIDNKIVGACVVKAYQKKGYTYPISDDYPGIHFKHMTVLGDYQSLGIGSKIVKAIMKEAFNYFNVKIIWSSSGELGALKFYNRLGAWFSMPSIERNNHKNRPEENKICINAMMQNSKLNKWRLPNDIMFAWVTDDIKAREYLASHDFKEQGIILNA